MNKTIHFIDLDNLSGGILCIIYGIQKAGI